jgi:ribosomal-protein-alanine N-acetyltransferase
MFPTLKTERLCLRQITTGDAEDLYSFFSDKELTRYLDWSGPSSIEDSKALIDSWNIQYEKKCLFPWGISLITDEQLIGTVMFMPIRGTFDQEQLFPISIGFELAKKHWNKGIMSETLVAILTFGREKIGAHRIQALVVPENTASLKILEKSGFKKEGLLKQYLLNEVTKKFMDVVLLALLFN